MKSTDIIIMIDLDGVIYGFDQSVKDTMSKNPGFQKLETAYNEALTLMPEFQGKTNDQIRMALKGPQEDPRLKAFKKIWNKFNDARYIIANRPGFFENLPLLPGAKRMLMVAASLTGKLPNILTAPHITNKNCEKEKRIAVERDLKGLYNQFICTQNKWEYAAPNTILVDDRIKFVEPFIANGGHGILHTNSEKTIKELRDIVDELISSE